MKRFIIIAVLLMGAVLIALILLRPTRRNLPRFVSAPEGFKVPAYSEVQYEFLLPSPFEGGLTWISIRDKNANHSYLYDLDQKKVLGELMDGWPVFGNRDQSKVVLMGNSSSLRGALIRLLNRLTGGKLNLGRSTREESIMVLDLKSNKAKSVGIISQFQGAGSRWYPSPTYRYGYTRPSANVANDILICDLDNPRLKRKALSGSPAGWWDETKILYKSGDHDFALYDVVTDQMSILLKASDIKIFLKQNELNEDLSNDQVAPFPMWEGGQYQFYLSDTHKRWEATNCFLAKLEKSSGKLRLIDADFKFEWSDSFDASGRYYLHGGRDFPADKISGVFVRDMQTGTTRTLVEDYGVNRHSIPRWSGSNVIYVRSNLLWQVSLTDTNPILAFPAAQP